MWVLVFIYFNGTVPHAERVDVGKTMTDCFLAREALSAQIGAGNGYFTSGTQAICIQIIGEAT